MNVRLALFLQVKVSILQVEVFVGTMQPTLSVAIMQVMSVAFMQVLRWYF